MCDHETEYSLADALLHTFRWWFMANATTITFQKPWFMANTTTITFQKPVIGWKLVYRLSGLLFNNPIYTVNHKKRWQYICDQNFGKSRSIFYNFCTVVKRKKFLCSCMKKCPPRLNSVRMLPCENKKSHFILL